MDWWADNLADVAVVGVVLVSALFAFFRGFVRETLAIAGWVGAAFATVWLFPLAQPYAAQWIAIPWLADLLAGVAIFVVTLAVLWLIIHMIVVRVKGSPLNTLDRSLGFLFGIARGLVLVALAYMVASQAAWRDEPAPDWVAQARVRPVIDYSAGVIVALVPEGTFNLPVEGFEEIQRNVEELKEAQEKIEELQRLTEPALAPAKGEDGTAGYKDADRKAIDQVFESLPDADEESVR